MQQVTIQDYRDAFINEHLPLTTIKTHRSVTQAFTQLGKQFNFNLTTRNIFDYLMFNANADTRSVTFGEVSDVLYSDIANYIGKKERTIENEVLKLCRAELIERHPTKRRVFIIPSMKTARDELIEQARMKKAMRVTKNAEKRITELEKDGVPITELLRQSVYTDEQKKLSNGKGSHQNGKAELPFG